MFICQRFWWPTMEEDTKEFLAACLICSQNKGSNQSPSGLLHPLSIPYHSWSHIYIDLSLEGNTIVLQDRSSHSSAQDPHNQDEIMLLQVFWLHRLPCDVISNRGPQFTFWREFCWELTRSPMDRQSRLTKKWRQPCNVLWPTTLAPGPNKKYG